MGTFRVSVIIPVFNLAKFLSKAVISAADLNEVGEVIIVEDGSEDDSLQIGVQLERKISKVKLLQHPGGENRGVSASRNLGIKEAEYPWIAFLDADDWYFSHRFAKEHQLLKEDSRIDAVYSCTILENYQEDLSMRYGVKKDPLEMIGHPVSDIGFYEVKLKRKWVLFHTNSITINRSFLMKDKQFDTRLALHEDSELWNRLLRRGHFVAGEVNLPVALIRRHDNNTITRRSLATLKKMHWVFIDNVGIDSFYHFEINYLFNAILRMESKHFQNTWTRRGYFYFLYYRNSLNKRQYIKKFYQENALN
ncbi:glycosyltransferase family 2 protein [Echinicola soli]|nr:glycosyltransferase family 2 protein [Echinicola soli]